MGERQHTQIENLKKHVTYMLHMEQYCYDNPKLEILGILLKEKQGHIRKIARDLKVNPMLITRKIKELLKENIVDFKQEGKNKVFSIKKSLEAKNSVLIYETNKLSKLIQKYPETRKIIEAIQANPKIFLAIIFGSYSKFTADKTSDIDLFIETENSDLKKELSFLSSKLSIKIGKYDKTSDLIKEIEKNHIVIKNLEGYYEKAGVFI